MRLQATICLIFFSLSAFSQCLIYESGLYRLSICPDGYELIRLDDPLEAGKFTGEIDRVGDTLILLHPRADSFIRAEFLTVNFRVFPIYLDPGLNNVFKAMRNPLVQSRLIDETGKMLRSWELSEKDPTVIAEYRYNDYLDMDTAYHFKDGLKEGKGWEKFREKDVQYIWTGSFSEGARNGKWKLYQLFPGYEWKLIAICSYRDGEVKKLKEPAKLKPLKQIDF